MKDHTPAPSPLLKATGTIARWSLRLMLSGWLLFAAIWGTLHLVIVPRIGDLRPLLETKASKVLGVPVTIGAISARSNGLIPAFELRDVKLFDSAGRDALTLGRVVAALSPQSLLSLGFDQLYIEAPRLEVRRTAQGKIFMGGLDVSRDSTADDGAGADWLFSQTELVIRNGTVNWTDEMRALPALEFRQVDVVLRNGFRNHRLRVDASPAPELGDRFSAMALFKQPLLSRHNGRWQDWEGQVYAAFERVDAARLAGYADLGIAIAHGAGSLRAWADIKQGQLASVTADLALSDVNTTLDKQLAALELHSVTGRLGGKLLSGGFEFATQDLQFQTRNGLNWPGGNFRVTHVAKEGNAAARSELEADRLDLAALAQIADRLPLGEQLHASLARWAPKGLVETLKGSWQGPFDASGKFDAKGRVAGLELAPRGAAAGTGAPGFRGVTASFDMTQQGGKASLSIDQGAIDLPAVFEDPLLPFARLSADIQWQIENGRISVQAPSVKFSNADAEGQAQLKWNSSAPDATRGGSRFPGVLDLQGTMSRFDGTRVHRYLPLVMLPQVRAYVRESVRKGTASGVKFKIKGDLYDLPFADPKKGEFRISANMADVTFAFLPSSLLAQGTLPWPELTQVSGELVFDRLSLQINRVIGRVATANSAANSAMMQIIKAEGRIPNMLQGATVIVSAEARGTLTSALGIVNGSPLRIMTGQSLSSASGTGNADLRLKLNLPLATLDKSGVAGSVTLTGNDVQISPQTPLLTRTRGIVNFTESGFSLANVQARLFGGDLRMEGGTVAASSPVSPGGTRGSPGIVLKAQGTISAEGLKAAKGLGLASRLAQNASGSAEFSAVLDFRQGTPELLLTSNLVGIALSLPAPLGKTAEAALPVRYENSLLRDARAEAQPTPGAAPARQLDRVLLDLGRLGSVIYIRDVSGPDAHVLRGSIAVGLSAGESAPLPEEGVVANVNLSRLDLDAWSNVLTQTTGARLGTTDAPSATTASTAPPASAGRAAGNPALAYLPSSMAVRTDELTVGGRKFGNVVVGGSRDGLTWRANMDAHELNGYVEYRQAAGGGPGRVYARLARLTLAQASAKDVETLLDEQPATIPALDIVVDDLELRGRRLGRVEIEAINRGAGAVSRDGGVREWRLNKFNILLPEATLTASGNWARLNAQGQAPSVPAGPRTVAERRRTVMNFKLDIADSGELLARFGMKDVIRRGKGKLEGHVSWVGSPLTPDFPTLGGAFMVGVEAGQFLKADPGIAKLFGVLSLQSLPRRLALDFRDVFSEGFSFDFVRGDVTIDQGIASTNNLQMKGVNAAVLMEGRANIAKETQDLRVIVVPEINAGTASLIATVINPAIGLGTFLAQVLLRRPLIESATQEFHIDGTWVDPVVTRVARKQDTNTGAKKEVGQ